MMIFHYFDPETRFYAGASSAPEGIAVPEHAVLFAPPALEGPQAAVLNDDGTAWNMVDDYRNWHVVDENGETVTVTEPGPLPEGWRHVPFEEQESAPPLEEIIAATIADYETRVQQRLDAFARTKTYENMLSACTYATSTVPAFRIEGQYCVEMRDATWITAQTFLNNALAAVMAGERDIPSWEEVEAELPALQWPEGSRGTPVLNTTPEENP